MLEQITKLILKIKEDPEIENNLSLESDLIYDVGFDSLQMIDFLLAVETEFNITLEIQELNFNKLRSIKTFIAFIEGCKNN